MQKLAEIKITIFEIHDILKRSFLDLLPIVSTNIHTT